MGIAGHSRLRLDSRQDAKTSAFPRPQGKELRTEKISVLPVLGDGSRRFLPVVSLRAYSGGVCLFPRERTSPLWASGQNCAYEPFSRSESNRIGMQRWEG